MGLTLSSMAELLITWERYMVMVWLVAAAVLVAMAVGQPVMLGPESGPLMETADSADTPRFSYRVVKEYSHRADAWTEGLSFVKGKIYESTGPVYKPGVVQTVGGDLSVIDLETGAVENQVEFKDIYGEGSTQVGSDLFVLSYKQRTIKKFRATPDLEPDGEIPLAAGEGWGATSDGSNLVLSDGSEQISFVNPQTNKVIRKISVHDAAGTPIKNLNELEWVGTEVWANIWETNNIARIDPNSGQLNGMIDLTGLQKSIRSKGNWPNGIAYQASTKQIVVTGKLWDKMYEIEVIPQ